MNVTLITEPDCRECSEVRRMLYGLAGRYQLQITELQPAGRRGDPERSALGAPVVEKGTKLPVVEVQEAAVGRLVSPITASQLTAYLDLARLSLASSTSLSATSLSSVLPAQPLREPVFDRVAGFIGRHWLGIAATALGVFVMLPWVAPVLAALGWWSLANPIYTIYSLQCHQLPERAAHVFGYEVCQCWRCNALYGGMFLFALGYIAVRDRDIPLLRWLKKPLPIWAFVLLLVPIAVDGISHMLGLRDSFSPGIQPEFGSFLAGSQVFSLNWILRIVTGLLAAAGSIWFAFPKMQRAIDDAEALRLMLQQQAMARRNYQLGVRN